jgi:hypothetical protein
LIEPGIGGPHDMDEIASLAWARNVVDRIRPQRIDAFFDLVQVRLRHPLTLAELELLKRHSRDQPYYQDMWQTCPSQRPPCPAKYRYLLQLRQPDGEALQELAKRNDLHVNKVEFASDWSFSRWLDSDQAFLAVVICFVKQRHGKQRVNLFERTFYSASQRVGNEFACYADKRSRITGEPCLHSEWRITGASNLRRVGVSSVQDLLTWDHRSFWQQRLLLYAVDRQRLGRQYNVKQSGRRRHRPWVEVSRWGQHELVHDHDAVRGRLLVNEAQLRSTTGHRDGDLGPRTQDVIDEYRGSLSVRRALVRLNTGHLLPEAGLEGKIRVIRPRINGLGPQLFNCHHGS